MQSEPYALRLISLLLLVCEAPLLLRAYHMSSGGGPRVRSPQRRLAASPTLKQTGGAGVSSAMAQQAAEMLGKMGVAAVKEAKPGEIPTTKEFVSAVKIRHVRTITEREGGAVADYMSLPVDQYAIYDSRLMRRLTRKAVE